MIRFRRAPALLLVAGLACQSNGPASPDQPLVVRVELSTSSLAVGPDLDETSFTVVNRGEESVEWRIESISARWISVDRTSGTLAPGEPAPVTVTITRDGLSRGTHVGTIRIVAGDKSLDVTVSLEHPGTARAAIDPGALELGITDVSGELTIRNTGDAPLEWTLSGPDWTSFEPASGTTAPAGRNQVLVTPDRSRLDPGSHTARLSLAFDGGDATATLTVLVPEPARLRLDSADLDFGTTATTRALTVTNDGELALDWSVSSGTGWISLQPAGGSVGPKAGQAVSVRVSRAGLSAGTHQASLRVRSNGGSESVTVRLQVPAPSDPDGGTGGDPGGDTGGDDPGGSDGGSGDDSGAVALEGRILDQFSRSPAAGVTVRFDGQTTHTDADGRFRLTGVPSDDLRALSLSASDRFSRKTFARTGDGPWLAIPGSFDMRAFDDMAREYEPRTIRWVRHPDVYFDVRPPAGYPKGSELDVWIEEVRGVLASFISGWTSGEIRAASLTVGTSPPPEGTPGTIVIGFSEDPSVYGDPRTVGLARTFWTTDRSIYSARIWLRFSLVSGPAYGSTRTAVVGHELGHALGMGHMNGGTASLMTPSISISNLSAFDRQAGNVLYTRSPGNTSPDSDTASYYRGGLTPAVAAGFHEWICDAPERRIR